MSCLRIIVHGHNYILPTKFNFRPSNVLYYSIIARTIIIIIIMILEYRGVEIASAGLLESNLILLPKQCKLKDLFP